MVGGCGGAFARIDWTSCALCSKGATPGNAKAVEKYEGLRTFPFDFDAFCLAILRVVLASLARSTSILPSKPAQHVKSDGHLNWFPLDVIATPSDVYGC